MGGYGQERDLDFLIINWAWVERLIWLNESNAEMGSEPLVSDSNLGQKQIKESAHTKGHGLVMEGDCMVG